MGAVVYARDFLSVTAFYNAVIPMHGMTFDRPKSYLVWMEFLSGNPGWGESRTHNISSVI